MLLWKKIVIGLVSILLLLVATGIGRLYFLGQSPSDICGVNLLRETPSPNGKLKAVLFQIDCGATTTGFNSHVAIMPSNLALSSNTVSFFAADRNGGKAPDGEGGGPEVQVNWVSDVQLKIQYHELARIFHNEKTSEGVNIVYHTFH